jgi:hypothetical protein
MACRDCMLCASVLIPVPWAEAASQVKSIEAMLRELRGSGRETDDDGADISAATNDEMFALIEKEFNI